MTKLGDTHSLFLLLPSHSCGVKWIFMFPKINSSNKFVFFLLLKQNPISYAHIYLTPHTNTPNEILLLMAAYTTRII